MFGCLGQRGFAEQELKVGLNMEIKMRGSHDENERVQVPLVGINDID